MMSRQLSIASTDLAADALFSCKEARVTIMSAADKWTSTEDACKGQGDMVLHRGPKWEESRFMEEDKPKWVLCQKIEG